MKKRELVHRDYPLIPCLNGGEVGEFISFSRVLCLYK